MSVTQPLPNGNSKLDDIMEVFVVGGGEHKAKEQVKALMLELIGEDKTVPRPLEDESRARFYRVSGQNFVRAELRKKVSEL